MQTTLTLPRRTIALTAAGTWRGALAAVVVISAAARIAVAWSHATPSYFPDEYIYAALGRGLGSVRGEWGHFPALLQPALAAPLWHVGSVETGYRLVQAFDATVMSLAAIPVWLLARRVGATPAAALACAALAVAVPDLLYASWIVAEPVAYPLVLAAVFAIVAVVERPSARAQSVALALCVLAAAARIQFVVLPLVYGLAVVACGGPRALGRHRGLLALFSVASAAAVALGPARLLGYYDGVLGAHVSLDASARAVGRNLLVLAYAAGFAIVPGAVLGLARARRSFQVVTASLIVLLLLQASLLGDITLAQERYIFYVVPLLAIAFATSVRGRTHALACAGMVALAAALPLSGYAEGAGKTHSAVLLGVHELEHLTGGVGAGALLVAAAAGALALGAAVLPRTIVLWLAVVAVGTLGASAVAFDHANSRDVARAFVAPHRSWVDDAHVGPATLVLGPNADKMTAADQLFWNRSLDRVALLPRGTAPDRFAAPTAAPARDGSLGLRGALLLDGYGSTVRLANARTVATFGTWTLVRPRGPARLAFEVTGRYADGWLSPAGQISVWSRTGTLTLVLTAPAAAKKTTMTFRWRGHTRRVALVPGRPKRVAIPVTSVPFAAAYSASSYRFVGSRPVSVRAAVPRLDAQPWGTMSSKRAPRRRGW